MGVLMAPKTSKVPKCVDLPSHNTFCILSSSKEKSGEASGYDRDDDIFPETGDNVQRRCVKIIEHIWML